MNDVEEHKRMIDFLVFLNNYLNNLGPERYSINYDVLKRKIEKSVLSFSLIEAVFEGFKIIRSKKATTQILESLILSENGRNLITPKKRKRLRNLDSTSQREEWKEKLRDIKKKRKLEIKLSRQKIQGKENEVPKNNKQKAKKIKLKIKSLPLKDFNKIKEETLKEFEKAPNIRKELLSFIEEQRRIKEIREIEKLKLSGVIVPKTISYLTDKEDGNKSRETDSNPKDKVFNGIFKGNNLQQETEEDIIHDTIPKSV